MNEKAFKRQVRNIEPAPALYVYTLLVTLALTWGDITSSAISPLLQARPHSLRFSYTAASG